MMKKLFLPAAFLTLLLAGAVFSGCPTGTPIEETREETPPSVLAVYAGTSDTFLLKTDGTLWAAGDNGTGAHGLGDTTARNTFTRVKDAEGIPITNVKQAAVGSGSAIILKNDGTIWGAGSNSFHELGMADTADHTYFTQITVWGETVEEGGTAITGVSYIAQGSNSSYFIKDGNLYATGKNGDGQLGLGDTTDRTGFNRVATDSDDQPITGVDAVFAGNDFAFFIKGGEVWATGFNQFGKLGLGDTSARNKFTKVPGLSGVIQISNQSLSVIALKNDGTAWAAGRSKGGSTADYLGITTAKNTDYSSFTQIPAITGETAPMTGITSIAGVCALLKNDGTVLSMGGYGAGSTLGSKGDHSGGKTFVPVEDLWNTRLTGVRGIAGHSNGASGRTFYILNNGDVLAAGTHNAAMGIGPGDGIILLDVYDESGLYNTENPNRIQFAD
jgi:alpha-tubulin suppressor-like RCC1 family protein